MWTIAANQKKLIGPLGTYNSLTDQHLTHYFKKPSVKRQLRNAGLITKEGTIIPDSIRKLRETEKQQQKQAHEFLANAIVQKTLELERLREAEIQHHLDDINKIELVERIKSARSKSTKNHASLPYQSASKFSQSADSLSLPLLQTRDYNWNKSSFPFNYTLPDYMLENIKNFDKVNKEEYPLGSQQIKKGSSAKLHKERKNENFDYQRSKSAGAKLKNIDSHNQIYKNAFKVLLNSSVSPYLSPILSKGKSISNIQRNLSANFRTRKKSKSINKNKKNNQHKISKIIEEPTAVNLYESHNNNNMEYFKIKKPVLQVSESCCKVTLCFHGATSTYAWMIPHIYQEVHIIQQHCGGNSICIFKKQLQAEDIFTFVSRRHRGYPFSITIFIDSIRHLRLSTCCEYRYQCGSKLGGKRGQFTLIDVQGSKPCFRCQVEESLGIYRPRHPPPSKYTKSFQQKLKKSINETRFEKSAAEDSLNKTYSKPQEKLEEEIKFQEQTVQHNSENSQESDKEIIEEIQEQILSENDDDIKEDLPKEALEQEHLSNSDNEEEVDEMINENINQDYSNTLVRQISRGSFEDSIPYQETCLSIEYNADSDEENLQEADQFKSNENRNDFYRQDSIVKSEDDSEALYKEESEILDDRKDSVDSIDYPSYNPNQWGKQNNQNYNSFSSDEEDEGVQHVVTADVHINASNTGN